MNSYDKRDWVSEGKAIFKVIKHNTNFELHEAKYLGDCKGSFTYSFKDDPNDKRGLKFSAGVIIYASEALLSYLMLHMSFEDKNSFINEYLPKDTKNLNEFNKNHGMFIMDTNFKYFHPMMNHEKIILNWKIEPYKDKTLLFSCEHILNGKLSTISSHQLKFTIKKDLVSPKF